MVADALVQVNGDVGAHPGFPSTADKAAVKTWLTKEAKFYGNKSVVTLTKPQQILTDTKHPALTQSIANNPAPESIAQIDEFVGQLHEALTKYVFSSKKASTASIRCNDHFKSSQ